MQNEPLVSIIIVNFNGRKYLKRCFDSLFSGRYKNIEAVFVDNGSSDGSLELVRNGFPSVKVLDSGRNLGLAEASNRGAAAASGEYFFFYNNDTVADERLIEKLVEGMESEPSVGVCGCRTYTYDGKSVINEGVPCDIFGYPYGKGGVFYVDAAIFIRRGLFFALGGFDEKMFLYGEDRDLCWRAWIYGYTVKALPEAVFYHDSACITGDINDYTTSFNKRFLGEYNSLRSLLKNYSLPFLAAILPLYAGINAAEMLAFILAGKPQVARRVYIRAYLENARDLGDTLKKRAKVQGERKVSDFSVIRRMLKVSGKLKLLLRIGLPDFRKDAKYGGN